MAYATLKLRKWLNDLRRMAVTPAGARTIAVGATLTLAIICTSFCIARGIPDLTTPLTREISGRFVWNYWASQWAGAVGLIALLSLIAFSPLVDRLMELRVAPAALDVVDFDRERVLRWCSRVAITLAAALFVLTLPFLNITVRPLFLTLFYLAFMLATPAMYMFSIAWPHCRIPRTTLSQFKFPRTPAFNIATIGATALEARLAKEIYHGRAADVVTPHLARELREGGDLRSIGWNGFDAFIERLAEFVNISADSISLHHNTTAAITAALAYSAAGGARIVYTDLEFPSVIDAVLATPGGDPMPVTCAARAWSGELNGLGVARLVAQRIAGMSHKRGSKIVICLSHVAYELGLYIEIEELLNLIERDDVIVIVDGAQAVGNVVVPDALLARVHFYAFSGHKWLLGDPTLGCLYANHSIIGVTPVDMSAALVAGRPYSFWKQPASLGGQTIDIDPYITLNTMLRDLIVATAPAIDKHNTALAKQFRRWIIELGVAQLPRITQRGGIVPVIVRDAATVAERLYERTGFSAQPIRDDAALRFCFHYNVGEWAVHRLAYELGRILYSRPTVERFT